MFVDQTNQSLGTISDVWSGVVDDLKVVRDRVDILKGDYDRRVEKVGSDTRKVDRLYTNQQRSLAEQQKEIYDLHKQISFYSCKVAALEGEKAEANERRFAQLEERLDAQNDLVSDLRDEVAVLRGQVCRCGKVGLPPTS